MSKASQKTSKEDNEKEAKRREALEHAIRHRVGCEEKAFRIVERLLDNPIEEDFLVDCAKFINPSHYADVVQERAIVKQCGYPICNNTLTSVPQQKYHINMKTNKVYDITDRKNFCSTFCYKASKYYGTQLSDSPVWTRDKDRPPDVKLLLRDSQVESKTSDLVSQDEIFFRKKIKESDIQAPDAVNPGDQTVSEKEVIDMVSDDLSTLTFGESVRKERLKQLAKIAAGVEAEQEKRKVEDKERKVEGGERDKVNAITSGTLHDQNILHLRNSQTKTEVQDDHNQVEETMSDRVNKQKSIQTVSPQDTSDSKQVQLSQETELVDNSGTNVPDQNPGHEYSVVKQKKAKSKNKPKKIVVQLVSPLKLLEATLLEWRTEKTLKYLRGEGSDRGSSVVEDSKSASEVPRQTTAKSEAEPGKRRREGLDSDDDSDEEPASPPSQPLPDIEKLKKETDEFALKVNEFYFGKPVKGTQKTPKNSDELVTDVKEGRGDSEVILPPVDSKSQMVIRRRITIGRLNGVLPDILLPMQLALRDISQDLLELIRTFNLSSHNITFKPNIWILVGIVLLHILATRNTTLASSLEQHHQFLTNILSAVGTSVEEVTQLVSRFHNQHVL